MLLAVTFPTRRDPTWDEAVTQALSREQENKQVQRNAGIWLRKEIGANSLSPSPSLREVCLWGVLVRGVAVHD